MILWPGCLLLLFQRQKIEKVEQLLLWLRHTLELIIGLSDELITATSPQSPIIISDDSEAGDDEEPWSPFNLQDVLVCMYVHGVISLYHMPLCVCVCVCVEEYISP